MTLHKTLTLFLVCSLASATACRSDDDPDTSSGGDGDGDSGTTPTGGDGDGDGDGDTRKATIFEIQGGEIAVDTRVNVRGVVITAIDAFGDRRGTVVVQEQDLNPNTGDRAFSGVSMFAVQNAADFEVGDLVDVLDGIVQEFSLNCLNDPALPECSDPLQTVTQISFATLVQVGTAEPPAPVSLRAETLAGDDNAAEAEKWEGVLIKLDDVAINSTPIPINDMDPTFTRAFITGPLQATSDFASLEGLAADDCLVSMTGTLGWFFNYQMLPRTAADLVKGGTGCPDPEATEALCANGVDDDLDGFTDCADRSCDGLVACTGEAVSVTVVEAKALEIGADVELAEVVVVGVQAEDSGGVDSIWVQDTNSTADNSGIQVFRGSRGGPLPEGVGVGSVVTVRGKLEDFFSVLQVDTEGAGGSVELVRNDGVPAYRTGVALSELADPEAGGELYEGQAVELSDLAVTASPTGDDALTFTVSDASGALEVSVFFNQTTSRPTVSACLATVRGVMSSFRGTRQLNLLAAGDLVEKDCP